MWMAPLDGTERCNYADLDTGGHGIIAEVDVQNQPGLLHKSSWMPVLLHATAWMDI